jgi:hypothetical protein
MEKWSLAWLYVTCANPPKCDAHPPARKRLSCCGKPTALFWVLGAAL